MSIKEYFESWKRERKEIRYRRIKERSKELYQITEYDNRLWFTYNEFPYCPCDMMKDEPLDALEKLRSEYIEHNT